MERSITPDAYDTAIAITGMAGRFPEAPDVDAFWKNLAGGVKSIRFFSEQELQAAGVSQTTLAQPNYVRAGAVVERLELFDAAFFGYTRREAEIMDPQHRLFLECAWQALEDAACTPETYSGLIGVFAGSGFSTYAARNLYTHPELIESLGELPVNLGNELDSLTSTVSYKLNLKGPSIAVQTFCSTSLVAVHLACRSLATYECDTALAGGVAITVPQERGYSYEEGGMLSPDGECRTFDMRARGSVMGNGVGVVVLKRFADALKDGDHIYALIRGSAVNNDGGVRVSYTAPGLGGQTEVIAEALGNADVAPETIGYIEAHGTATMLGDAVELAALLKVFGRTPRKRFCALGSVKPNIGHLNRASGVTGLIKTALALHHKQIPPQLNFERPNDDIDLENSPFYINTTLQPWLSQGLPRRAGVNSFGIGGTNAHVILEEAPMLESTDLLSSSFLLVLSARTASALSATSANLANYLRAHPQSRLADVAYTLQVGRTAFNYRKTLLCREQAEAVALLEQAASGSELFTQQTSRERQLTFLFSEEEDLCGELALALYQQAPPFRAEVDDCCRFLCVYCELDTHELFTRPEYKLWATFVCKYALARMYVSWGVRPGAVLGSGVGMYAAACVAGVLSLEDALLLLVRHEYPQLVTASPARILCQKSDLLCISYATSQVLSPQQVTDAAYWLSLLDHDPVQVDNGPGQIVQIEKQVLFSIGTKPCFCSWLEQRLTSKHQQRTLCLSALSLEQETTPAWDAVLTTLGLLWQAGVNINWAVFYSGQRLQRLSLPAYPFERQRYWIEAGPGDQALLTKTHSDVATDPIAALVENNGDKRTDLADWFYLPSWRRSVGALYRADESTAGVQSQCWLIFVDRSGLAGQLADHLRCSGHTVVTVEAGSPFSRMEDHYIMRPDEVADYEALLKDMRERGRAPQHIVHLWAVGPGAVTEEGDLDEVLAYSFYSLLRLTQALGNLGLDHCQFTVISSDMQDITGSEKLSPVKATLIGPCRVIPQEYPAIVCRSIDISFSHLTEPGQNARLVQQLLAELTSGASETMVALRGPHRWTQAFEQARLSEQPASGAVFRERGVYLITGGLGGIGLAVAEYLARTAQARLVLLGRKALPPRAEWPALLEVDAGETPVARQVRGVLRLEELGAEVLLVQADVCDEEQMNAALHRVLTTFGELHGVLHVAGVPASGLMQLKTREMAESVLGPKVRGTQVLGHILRDLPLDFLALFSSVCSATGGGPGQVDYCAASAFLDAYAHRYSCEHGRTVTLDWGEWQWNAWEDGLTGYPWEVQQYFRQRRQRFGIGFEEGFEALTRVLANPLSHVVVSSEDFQRMLAGNSNYSIATILRGINAFREAHAATSYARPALGTEYVPPESELEREIAAIWSELLGIEQIGLLDNFFELGGHSLMGTQLIARLRRAFGVDIRLITLFEAPTIAELAVAVELLLIDDIEQASEGKMVCIQEANC